jgi:hypothetical protein
MESINIVPSWHAALVQIVPMALENGGREAAIEVLEDAASKLELLSSFINSDPEIVRKYKEFTKD